jgi:hypothetical protein
MKGVIGIAAFSRAHELDRCLESVVKARSVRDLPLLVLHQQGHAAVGDVIQKWRSEIQILLQVEALGSTPLQNINLNAILLRNLAFQELQSDWFLGVEEDVVIGGDSIAFIESMMKKYRKTPAFRGVNLGSAIPRNLGSEVEYSRIRYGLHGQAGAIPKNVWEHFNNDRMLKYSNQNGLDGMMENYLKSGFMCWPNLSRYLDNGWNGTHAPKDSNDAYYQNLRQSFVDLSADTKLVYIKNDMHNPWREDCFNYKPLATPFHFTKNLLNHVLHSKLRTIRKVKSKN